MGIRAIANLSYDLLVNNRVIYFFFKLAKKNMTVLELLLNHLPEKYVDRIASNMVDKESLYNESFDISAEMLSLFDWETSREGFDFWSSVLESIEEGLKPPPLPIDINYAPNTHLLVKENQWMVMNTGGLDINMKFQYESDKVQDMVDRKKYEIFSSFVN